MMSGLTIRRITVLDRINQFPEKEKNLAREMYIVLGEIELLLIAFLYISIIALVILACAMIGVAQRWYLSGDESVQIGLIFSGTAIVYGIVAFLMQRVLVHPLCMLNVRKLKRMLSSDPGCPSILTKLKGLDPAMAEYVKNYLAQLERVSG